MKHEIAGFSNVCVIGAGQMGRGIAQVIACAGLKVSLLDSQPAALARAKQEIETSATKLHSKGIVTADQLAGAKSISCISKFDELGQHDLAIEAIVENEAAKKDLYSKLNEILPEKAIFASNTSSLPITRLAAASSRPEQFIGMHFMNPVPLMRLVEVIPGMGTRDEVKDRICQLATKLGKEVAVSKDYPGFIVNRILMPMINEGFNALLEGIAAPEDIDKGMCLGTNQPMGPLKLADFIGLDTCLAIMEVLHSGLGDPRYRPSPLLRQYVDAGWLGKKSGRGVYAY